jgi:hypothetical protein
LQSWEQRVRTDSIASWVNDCVVFDPCATTAIGSDRTEGLSGDVPATLYGSYALHCHRTGTNPKANKNFSPDLLELCNHILGMTVEKVHTKVGKQIKGIRLRTAADFDLPTLDYQMMEAVTDSVTDSVTGAVTGQDLDGVRISDFGDGSDLTPDENEKLFEAEGERSSEPLNNLVGSEKSIEMEVLPVTFLETSPDKDSDPSPNPSPSKDELKEAEYLAEAEETDEEEFKEGDRIIELLSGIKGVVVGIRDGRVVFDCKEFGRCSRPAMMLQKI